MVASAARHDLDVWAYLRAVLERLAIGAAGLPSLLPDAWAAAHPDAIRCLAHEREAQADAKRTRRKRRRALERAKAQRR